MFVDRSSTNPNYGPWKFSDEITFQDMLNNPVWLWCLDTDEGGVPDGGTEATLRPLLNTTDVPPSHISPPLILLRIKGGEYYASGLYFKDRKKLEAIIVYKDDGFFDPSEVNNLVEPVIYLAVPSINGYKNVEFESPTVTTDEAFQIN